MTLKTPGLSRALARLWKDKSGGTVEVQLDYQYNFLIGGLVGLDPIALQGDSAMVVL